MMKAFHSLIAILLCLSISLTVSPQTSFASHKSTTRGTTIKRCGLFVVVCGAAAAALSFFFPVIDNAPQALHQDDMFRAANRITPDDFGQATLANSPPPRGITNIALGPSPTPTTELSGPLEAFLKAAQEQGTATRAQTIRWDSHTNGILIWLPEDAWAREESLKAAVKQMNFPSIQVFSKKPVAIKKSGGTKDQHGYLAVTPQQAHTIRNSKNADLIKEFISEHKKLNIQQLNLESAIKHFKASKSTTTSKAGKKSKKKGKKKSKKRT